MSRKKKRVVVAMSGGVDSSVVACLLKEQGFEVIGITLQLYENKNKKLVSSKTCCAGQDIYDAKEVARKINIPHYVLNYKKKFEDYVISNFINSYQQGLTPIPCVNCNQYIKFSELLKTAIGLDAEYLATGHYIKNKKIGEERALFIAKDVGKDQSYFLFQTKKKDLSYLKFPLGNLDKTETRKLAQKFEIKVADKPESQDICFIPDGNYTNFLSKYSGFGVKGQIVDKNNKFLSEHKGIENYTIGQRKRLNVAVGKPLYVLNIIKEENKIIVGEKKDLEEQVINIKEFNWLGSTLSSNAIKDQKFLVKVRARQKPTTGKLELLKNNKARITLDHKALGVAKGQGCVIYNKNFQLLGGGWIT